MPETNTNKGNIAILKVVGLVVDHIWPRVIPIVKE